MAGKRAKRGANSAPQLVLEKPGDRVEAQFDGIMLNLYQAPGAGVSPDYSGLDPRSLDAVTAFVRQGLFLPVMFNEDNGCTARFQIGDPGEQEAAEWIGRVLWKLDLRSGRLGCNEVVIGVPPGEYQVEVCLYLPSSSASRILEILGGKKAEPLWDYWMRTRPGVVLSPWLAELATSQDEDVVPAELLPPDDGTDPLSNYWVKVGGRLRKLPQSSPVKFLDVVVRLAPHQADLSPPLLTQTGFCWGGRVKPKPRADASIPCFFLWEGRKPLVCPAGLPSESFVA
jgi:hypothetical protein